MKQVKDITTDAGKEALVNEVIKSLEKAGYTLAATSLKALMRFDLSGAFEAISTSNLTDVAGLLWRKRDEFVSEKNAEIEGKFVLLSQREFLKEQLRESVNRSITDYLKSINYEYNFKHGNLGAILVFPDIKFDFKPNKWNEYLIEEVKPKQ